MPPLLLASTSPYRRQLLERLGIAFACHDPEVDESAFHDSAKDPRQLAQVLAAAKADAISQQQDHAVVIGCDQVCALDQEVLGKPGSAAAAVAQLERLQGREHLLLTAVALRHGATHRDFVETTRMTMRPMPRHELQRYVATDNPIDCAGSYKIEQAGIALFDKIQGEDHTAIIGLPLMRLCHALRELGVDVP